MAADEQDPKIEQEDSGRWLVVDEVYVLERDEASAARRERLLGELVRRGRAGEGPADGGETVPVATHQDGSGIPFALDERGDPITWQPLPTQSVAPGNGGLPVILSIDESANLLADGPGVIDPKGPAESREALMWELGKKRLMGELRKKTRTVYTPRWPEGTRVIDLDSYRPRQSES